ncbi:imidazole glycerol phosphate synthase subunit HisH [Muricauda ruestringensis]|uniref:Imidazole glycerol phosphate synthase subunit HisH n=1 Tax=Flagellimonas aurea TaxID=2915619 RepID=A0ABS3G0C6_9FLAO|nr:imidazole glycerol phosphate synthase subunit HisH [Allomuricauda aurea]MAO18209.1 imidazole glycerol phosphate synthase subunit HisH [Allomuricauda sp.]MBC71022.1 imidazole glycerol phosphate synthase subunit HisH [Allomuricauda sp.]MBO0352835.1 imidazole glycerol phosphate synthase subunit HisH [Allomuricauda aurea]|tara:strand:+ start:14405 stop:15019 length:615 start_codon:yes stop_codon:yes gene_type:complete
MIKIVNYGSGNIQAILNIYKQLDIECVVAENPEQLGDATKLILPGVGAFDETMQELLDSGFQAELNRLVLENKIPVLGVCVGMQILAKRSDEGKLQGLGFIDGEVKKFDSNIFEHKPHLPHLGWNSIEPVKRHPIFDNIGFEEGFYFLHTYYFSCSSKDDILATTEYGLEFSSAVNHENIFGMQFHPEKSHSNGIQLFKNFANL